MTDKPKTIQEALAKVQRNVDEDFSLPDLKKIRAAGAAAKQKISDVAQGVSDYINRPVRYNPDQPTIGTQGTNHPANVPASTVFDKIKSGQSPASTPATPKTEPAKTETPPNQETPKTEPAKTETPPAGSSAAKMSFNQAYAKAREMAKAAGKNPNIAQFKWGKDGGPEKTYQAAETKADYVTKNKQFAVDINAPSTTKNPADPPSPNPIASTTPKADATGMPPATPRNIPAGSEGAKYPAEGGVRQAATGTFEKGEGYATIREPKKPETESGKKKMSEEHINELSKFGAAFAAARRAGKSEFSFGGKSFNTRLASSSPSKPSGPYGAPGLVGPGAKVTRLDAPLPPRRPEQKSGSSNETLPVGSGAAPRPGVGEPGGQTSPINAAPRKPPEQGGSSNPPTTTGDRTPVGGYQMDNQRHSGGSNNPPTTTGDRTPVGGGSITQDAQNRQRISDPLDRTNSPVLGSTHQGGNDLDEPKTESGGKRRKVSEESSPIIAMFLKLQEKHALTPNIFEAAKKAKKDYDGDDKVESEKDEYFGSRFAAAKKAGKMEEEEQIDEISDETVKSHTKKVLEKLPKQIAKKNYGLGKERERAKDWLDKRNKGSVLKMKRELRSIKEEQEEVEFSQAEIDYINSFLEAVAPSRAEPTKGVNPTVRNTDLTDETLDELKKPTPETALKVVNRANDRDEWSAKAANRLYSRYKKGYEPKEKKTNEEYIEEGRPRKNPTPETTERDAREHIQVQAGRAAGGTVVDFKHDNGKVSKLTPGMGRSITAHLNGLKPAERQEAVKRMHASPEGLKV